MNDLIPASIREEIIFSYINLGVKRKIFLAFNWVVTALFVCFLIAMIFLIDSASNEVAFVLGGAAALLLLYAYWLHVAISKRNVFQLNIIMAIQLIPFLNPISFLCLLLIRNKSELEVNNSKGLPMF